MQAGLVAFYISQLRRKQTWARTVLSNNFNSLSLSHIDGGIPRSPKPGIFYMESNQYITKKILFLFHVHFDLNLTFGGLANYLLARILN